MLNAKTYHFSNINKPQLFIFQDKKMKMRMKLYKDFYVSK